MRDKTKLCTPSFTQNKLRSVVVQCFVLALLSLSCGLLSLMWIKSDELRCGGQLNDLSSPPFPSSSFAISLSTFNNMTVIVANRKVSNEGSRDGELEDLYEDDTFTECTD